MKYTLFRQAIKLVFIFPLLLGLFMPANSTLALPQKTASAAQGAENITVEYIMIKYRTSPNLIPASPSGAAQMARINTAAELTDGLTYAHAVAGTGGAVHILQLSTPVLLPAAQKISADLQTNLKISHTITTLDPDYTEYILELEYAAPLPAPDDTQYAAQWNLQGDWGINAPMAWDATTGAESTIVAVIDNGIIDVDSSAVVVQAHEDLHPDRILLGYDFISDPRRAADGDGRDSNPSDPGDGILQTDLDTGFFTGCSLSESSWHGTQTVGIIGATSNNNLGVAGINWNAKILPVRVIGKCGGDVNAIADDVMDGIRWAAGLAVPGTVQRVKDVDHPENYPANVLNVGVGVPGVSCSAYQADITTIINSGAVIVAAAGDDSAAAINFPANCEGVITVAGTDSTGNRASVSNYGAAVEISAPGSNVYTTSNDGGEGVGASIYEAVEGSDVAAANVSGVVSLMFAVNPLITSAQVIKILEATDKAFPSGNCTTSTCGSGIVNAGEALKNASQPDLVITEVTIVPEAPTVGVPFTVTVKIKNQGGSTSESYVNANAFVDDGDSEDPERNPLEITNKDADGCFLKYDTEEGIWKSDTGDNESHTDFTLGNVIPGATSVIPIAFEDGLPQDGYVLYIYADANCVVREGFENNNHYMDPEFPNQTIPIPLHIGVLPAGFDKSEPDDTFTPMLSSNVTLKWGAADYVDSYEYCIDTTYDNLCEDDPGDPGDGWISTGDQRSVDLTGLSGGTEYWWQVRAKNLGGYTYANDGDPADLIIDGWWPFKTLPVPVLLTPSNQSVVPLKTPILTISPASGVSQYQYQVSAESDFDPLLLHVTSGNASYTLTAAQALPAYGTYYWRAKSTDLHNHASDWSVPHPFSYTFQTAPVHNGYMVTTKPVFIWKAISGALEYRLQVSKTADFASLEIDRSQTTLSYVSPLPMDYSVYYWRVSARTVGDVWSAWGLGSKFTLTPPLSPAPVLLTPLTKAFVSYFDLYPTLTWKKVTDDDRYEVQVDNFRSFASPEETLITATGQVSHTINTVLPQGIYYWRVRTSNYLSAPGAWSAVRYFTVDTTPLTLAPVLVSPAIVASSAGSPTFLWKAVSGAAKYQIQYDYTDEYEQPIEYTSFDLTTVKHIPPAMPLGTYVWHVRAKDAAGNPGPWSESRTITITAPKPLAPILTAPAISLVIKENKTPDFAWNSVSFGAPYVFNYEFQLSKTSTFAAILQTNTSAARTYTSDTILDDGIYYWRVRSQIAAVPPGLPGAWSVIRSFRIDTILPIAPTLNLPRADLSVTVAPTFSWLKVADAVRYQFEYDDSADFNSPAAADYTSLELSTLSHLPKPTMLPGTYSWRVKAKDAAGNWSSWSEVRTITILAAPGLVSPANAYATVNTTPAFTWNAAVSGVAYDLEISKTTNFAIKERTYSDIPDLTYTLEITDELPHGVYYWHVRAKNASGVAGAWSAYRLFTVDITAPPQPILSSPANNTQVLGNPTFRWSAPATAQKYLFEYASDEGFTTGVSTPVELALSRYAPSPAMTPGIYYWHVLAKDALGNVGEYSAPFKVEIFPIVPPAPVLTAPASNLLMNTSQPLFTWSPVVSGNQYEIEIATDTLFLNKVSLTPSPANLSVTSYTPETILDSGVYYWHVRAFNVIGTPGAWSITRTFTVDTQAPAAPTLTAPLNPLTVTGTPIFRWLKSDTAIKYRFEYDVASSFDSPIGVDHYVSNELAILGYTPPVMKPGTYYWHVQAKDAAGNWGAYTAEPFVVTINPPKPATPVTFATAAALKDTTPTLTWRAVGAAPYTFTYEIQIADNSQFTTGLVSYADISGTSYEWPAGLSEGLYYWRVQAKSLAAVPVVSAWSAARYFVIDITAQIPPILSLPSVPEVKGSPIFSWKASVGANRYQFQYATNVDFSENLYTSAILTTTSHRPPIMSLGTYYWRVKAGDAADNWSGWGEVRALSVVPLVPTGIPVLYGPVNGYLTSDTTPNLVWNTVVGAVRYDVEMDTNSTFSSREFVGSAPATVAPTRPSIDASELLPGVYYWRVRKVDRYGGVGTWSVVRRLTVTAP